VIISNNVSSFQGGGLFNRYSNQVFENVIISNNIASHQGAGLFCYWSDLKFENVTLANNSAGHGGAFFCSTSSDLLLRNCILRNDLAEEIYITNSATVTILYTNIQGGQGGINGVGTINWLEGNIDEDPLFGGTSWSEYPYTLLLGSPCIDAGDPDTVYNDPGDPNNLGFALWPAMGTIRNDMGAYGGSNATSWNITPNSIKKDEIKEAQTPTEFELAQNYPNPFNPSTTIQYSIKEKSIVELVVYDILSAQVKVLVNEEQDAGYYKISFNADGLASGIYIYRIKAGSFVETKKMILMK